MQLKLPSLVQKNWKTAWLFACVLALAFAGPSCGKERGRTDIEPPKTRDSGGGTTTPDLTATPDIGTPTPDRAAPERAAPPERRTPGLEPATPDLSTPDPGQRPEPPPVPDVPAPPEQTTPEPTPERTAPDVPPTPTTDYRFIAMGDAGTGSTKQKAVAQAIKMKCDAEAKPGGRGKCDFAIFLGDNFYDIGVKSATDPLFKTHFVDMYHMLGFPFYISIGNHDYGVEGIGGAGFGFDKLKHYVAYAKTDNKFILPSSFYTFKKGNTSFVALNTAELFFDYNLKDQTTFVQKTIAAAKNSTWKIAFGHHPYISNGTHGNAGQYEGIPIPIPYVSGTKIKKFFDNEICNKVDFYFSGHDHNIQILEPKCGVNFVVSGAGAKNKKWGDKNRNKFFWQSETILGFVYVHVKGRTVTLQVIDDKGVMQHQKVYTK